MKTLMLLIVVMLIGCGREPRRPVMRTTPGISPIVPVGGK